MDQNSPLPGQGQPSRSTPPTNLPVAPGGTQQSRPQGIDLRFSNEVTAPRPPASGSIPQGLTPPKPVPPPAPVPNPATPSEYKSSIRSMADDIAKVKVGQAPSGTELQKMVSPQQTPTQPVAPVPAVQAPTGPEIQARLGNTERAKPFAGAPIPPPRSSTPPAPTKPVQAMVPPSSGQPSSSRAFLYTAIIVLVLLLSGGSYWFMNRDSVVETPTPSLIVTATATPTPTPPIGSLITGGTDTIAIATTGDPITDFLAKINALTVAPGEMRKVVITSELKGSGDFTITDLLDRFLISYPSNIKPLLGTDATILVFGQREIFTSKGQLDLAAPSQKRLIFLTEVIDPITLNAFLTTWEPTMADALSPLLGLNKAKAAGTGFLTNTYGGASIRYRNFPYPDRSIDYSLVPGPNSKTYLMVAGSRESALNVVDLLNRK